MQETETVNNISRLLDVEMNVTVRFGKTEVPLREIVRYGVGSMIELNRSVDEPVDLLVNNFPFAKGEVVVVDGYYGVKVTEIGSQEARTETLLNNSVSEESSEVQS
jgi:flagellar motor switch protein FliN